VVDAASVHLVAAAATDAVGGGGPSEEERGKESDGDHYEEANSNYELG
jgi:hypothetical protein